MALVDIGQCEAYELIPTKDDAIYTRCPARGIRVFERDEFGHLRTRIACRYHRGAYLDQETVPPCR